MSPPRAPKRGPRVSRERHERLPRGRDEERDARNSPRGLRRPQEALKSSRESAHRTPRGSQESPKVDPGGPRSGPGRAPKGSPDRDSRRDRAAARRGAATAAAGGAERRRDQDGWLYHRGPQPTVTSKQSTHKQNQTFFYTHAHTHFWHFFIAFSQLCAPLSDSLQSLTCLYFRCFFFFGSGR